MVIGLTGGIASGKSTVSNMLRDLGGFIVDADLIARKVVEPDQLAWREIVEHFGEQILLEDRSINRTLLGSIVFQNAREREVLNRIVHPRVREEMIRQTEEIRERKPRGIVIWDVPLLIEGGLYQWVEKIIVVYVDPATQLRRLMKRDSLSETEAKRRIAAQMPLAEKVKFADFLIHNEGTLEDTRKQVNRIWNEIKASLD
ncbi:dephospho-CoA kinase [Collibacillus ludicampi]|uniref:Dephospho-CoA kinase n=1 Tax=Collibacillus ludicampi TaxID=2771369 RepID=A0AAV4LI48_9BACL|nr:dephospho-CoA kinase [Collibacillus ludicampi]GIM47127.1 dephospho-CoA kinase [Collibacillus ludicampi]